MSMPSLVLKIVVPSAWNTQSCFVQKSLLLRCLLRPLSLTTLIPFFISFYNLTSEMIYLVIVCIPCLNVNSWGPQDFLMFIIRSPYIKNIIFKRCIPFHLMKYCNLTSHLLCIMCYFIPFSLL